MNEGDKGEGVFESVCLQGDPSFSTHEVRLGGGHPTVLVTRERRDGGRACCCPSRQEKKEGSCSPKRHKLREGWSSGYWRKLFR